MIDYMIMEAVAVKAAQEEEAAQKERKRRDWQADKSDLRAAIANAT